MGTRRINKDLFDIVNAFDVFAHPQTSYPPYNMIKDGDNYTIHVVLNGGKKEDVSVSVEDGKLTIKYDAPAQRDEGIHYLHKGISTKSFTLKFNINHEHLLEDVTAKVEDGILVVNATFKQQPHKKIQVL